MNIVISRKIRIIQYLLFTIIGYLFATNHAFSLDVKLVANEIQYSGYQLDIKTDLYDEYDEIEETKIFYDPFETVNRKIFAFNMHFNRIIVTPVGKGYRKITTQQIRRSVNNVLNNLRSPVIFMNSVLQCDADNSAKTVMSFIINSTVGVLGIFNPAAKIGIQNEDSDFGQTLGKWNIGTGPYLVIPILGPSDLRDGTGFIVDKLIDPFDFNILRFGNRKRLVNQDFRIARMALYGLDISDFLVQTFMPMVATSFDPYIMTRNAFLQNRNYKINKNR
jgi:phospholipid-binding lipoprotein MlaA